MSSSSKCVCPRHMWHTKDSDSGSGSGCGGATWMRHVSAHRKNLETWRCVRLSGKVALWLREKCSPKSMKSQLATWLEPVARGSPRHVVLPATSKNILEMYSGLALRP